MCLLAINVYDGIIEIGKGTYNLKGYSETILMVSFAYRMKMIVIEQ